MNLTGWLGRLKELVPAGTAFTVQTAHILLASSDNFTPYGLKMAMDAKVDRGALQKDGATYRFLETSATLLMTGLVTELSPIKLSVLYLEWIIGENDDGDPDLRLVDLENLTSESLLALSLLPEYVMIIFFAKRTERKPLPVKFKTRSNTFWAEVPSETERDLADVAIIMFGAHLARTYPRARIDVVSNDKIFKAMLTISRAMGTSINVSDPAM